MNKQTEALKMAIEALENVYFENEQLSFVDNAESNWKQRQNAIQACKEALAQPAQEYLTRAQQVIRANNSAQEPVAWGKVVEGRFSPSFSFKFSEQKRDGYTPLYTHPAPSWQGLSEQEIKDVLKSVGWIFPESIKTTDSDYSLRGVLEAYQKIVGAIRAIEQALKERNHGDN